MNIHWKDWCWSWNSITLATWCEELTHWKRPWWWERLKVGGEGDDRGRDDWMALPTRCTAAHQASLFFTSSHSLLKLMFIESVMPFYHLILCRLLLLLPSIFPSIRVFSNESALHLSWPKYWRFSFSISPSSEYSGLMSFRINWFYLPAVQGTLKSLLQHHNSKALTLGHSLLYGPT